MLIALFFYLKFSFIFFGNIAVGKQVILDDIDGVLLMTVNPGFAGQKMVPHSIEKIRKTRSFLDANGRSDAEIEVDGNVSIENAIKMKEAGANIYVLGTAIQSKKGFSSEDFSEFSKNV